jgi:cytochrome c
MTSITCGVVVRGLTVLLMSAIAVPISAAESPPAAFNNHCRTCHSVKEGDNRLGPSLHNVHGAKAGSSSAYAGYSHGMKNSGVVWDDATLDKFIENPEQVIPNNNMKPYKGIADPAVRKQIVDFLKNASKQADGA